MLKKFFRIILIVFLVSEAINLTGQTCNCSDYIYANDVDLNETHKFRVNSDGSLTEVLNTNTNGVWSTHGIIAPHGLGADLNGYLYISGNGAATGAPGWPGVGLDPIFKLNCEGQVIDPVSNQAQTGSPANYTPAIDNPLFDGVFMRTTNFHTQDGILYAFSNQSDEVIAFELCTYNEIGRMNIRPGGTGSFTGWGFYIDGSNWYATNRTGTDDLLSGSLDISLYTSPTVNSGTKLFNFAYGGIMGITSDEFGNFYAIESQNAGGSNNNIRITKYDNAGNLLDEIIDNTSGNNDGANTANGQEGWWGTRGIVYSQAAGGRLYLGGMENCVTVFDTDLNQIISDNIGNPLAGNTKSIQIQTECCPVSTPQIINVSLCESNYTGRKYFLNDLFPCDGIICGGEWASTGAVSGLTFNDCDQSITLTSENACGEFTKTGGGTPTSVCGAFQLTLNISVKNLTAPVIAGDQSDLCPSDIPSPLTITTPGSSNVNVSYQWQMSTSSCSDGFTNVGAASASAQPYQPPAITQTSYYRLLVSTDTGCNSGECQKVSNCLTLTAGTNCVVTCPAPPSVSLTPANIDVCGDDITTFNYTVDNGPANLSHNASGTLSATQLSSGSGTFTYTPSASFDNGVASITAAIPDPDGAGPCSAASQIVTVTITPRPEATVSTTPATCNGTTPNTNAEINLTGITGDVAGISTAGSTVYNGSAYDPTAAAADLQTVSGGSSNFSGLPHNTQYTVRIWNGEQNCFTDETILIEERVCLTYYSLGNRVFYDDDLNGEQNGTENGIDGISLRLLNGDGSIYDSDSNSPGIQALILTTAGGGYYRFDELPAGNYIVEVLASNFISGSTLENYSSSEGVLQETNPDNNGDLNDNGLDTPVNGATRSGVVNLGGIEPTGEAEPGTYPAGSFSGQAAADTESNLTVDFGFYRQRDLPDCCDPDRPLCNEEPCHFINNDIYFGGGVTGESSLNTNAGANTDTDDGLLWGINTQPVPGGVLNLPIEVYNNTGNNAFLRIWIDWNNNGDFNDAGEQVLDEMLLNAVYNNSFTLNRQVNIPANTENNLVLPLRMRLSTDTANSDSACGNGTCAADGEIEDYIISISCTSDLCLPVTLRRL